MQNFAQARYLVDKELECMVKVLAGKESYFPFILDKREEARDSLVIGC